MSVNWVPTKGPKTRQLAEARFHQLLFLATLQNDDYFLEVARKEIPEAWHTLEMDVEARPPKQKVTLYLDKAVIAIFRKMGDGYQGRINRILETWLQMKMAEKAVFKKDVMDAVRDARLDKNREDVGDGMKAYFAELLEHWAYAEGVQDTMARVEEGKSDE